MTGRTTWIGAATLVVGLSITAGAEETAFERKDVADFPTLGTFESTEAFEKHVGSYVQACLDMWGGGSAGASCPIRSELWDRELNTAYARLIAVLDEDGKAGLKTAQLAWIAFRDTTGEFNSFALDRHYDEDGTMYHPMRALDVDSTFAAIIKARTLLLQQWHLMIAKPVSSHED